MTNEKRLIDANAVPKLFEKKYEETEQRILDGETYLDTLAEGFTEVDDVILSMPTVDAVEVVHAYWVGDEPGDWHCSHCGEYAADGGFEQTKYCPNCGAKMDGERRTEK
jgi:rubrerythrin